MVSVRRAAKGALPLVCTIVLVTNELTTHISLSLFLSFLALDYFRMLVEYSYVLMTMVTFYYEVFSWYAAVKQSAGESTVWNQIATGEKRR